MIKILKQYQSGRQTDWKGREDGRIHQLMTALDLNQMPSNIPPHSVGFLGFCCDEGVRRNHGRPGAARGPDSFRGALANLPYHGKMPNLYDCGSIICAGEEMEQAQQTLGDAVACLVKHGLTPFVVGGGHELAYGHYLGLSESHLSENLAILNIDAHYDLRPLTDGRGNSGTSFTQIAEHCHQAKISFDYACIGVQKLGNSDSLIKKAANLGVTTLFAEEIHEGAYEAKLQSLIDNHERLYLTICLDSLAAAFAPGVSAPQPLGLFPHQVISIIRKIAASGKLVSCDIAELSPPFDRDLMTARLAASFCCEILQHLR